MNTYLSLTKGLWTCNHWHNYSIGDALLQRFLPYYIPVWWSVIRIQQVSPLTQTKSLCLPVFFNLTPEKEKSTERPWLWWIARLVELGPGIVLVIFVLIQLEQLDITSDRRLDFRTPSMNLWADYTYSLKQCPSLWCIRVCSDLTQILQTGMDWITNSRNGVASRADCQRFKSLLLLPFRALQCFKICNWQQSSSIGDFWNASSSSRACKAALLWVEIVYMVACLHSATKSKS